MAADEIKKKFGTIFMGEREASVEQLNAMQEPLNRERHKKEYVEDYMERVKAKAADRAREILGAAYTERQKVLDESKAEAEAQKKLAQRESVKIKAESESLRKAAREELEKAQAIREEAEKIRAAAHSEGFQAGVDQAAAELHEFRAELGQSLGSLLNALEGQRKNILEIWREDLAELTQCAVQAGTGLILQKEHKEILRALVFQALDQLENHASVSMRVNPADEENVSNMFNAARDRFPNLKQWIVIGDDSIEPCGLVVESGSGSVDLKRENFRELVDGVLTHLSLPETEKEAHAAADVRELVEREVAHIASMTPEIDKTPEEQPVKEEAPEPEAAPAPVPEPEEEQPAPAEESAVAEEAPVEAQAADIIEEEIQKTEHANPEQGGEQNLRDLEEELFPLDEEPAITEQKDQIKKTESGGDGNLSEGGFI